MSVNSKMTALANAVRNKSGRTGKMSIDAMTEAVNGISCGTIVQTSTGTFVSGTSSQPVVTVNCGFRPDVVRLVISDELTDSYPYEVTVDFNISESDNNCFALWADDDADYGSAWSVIFGQTDTGFTVNAYAWDNSWEIVYPEKTFHYTAKKYT